MPAPFEVLPGPFTVYTGPVNEARTDLNDAPAGNWVKLGTNGDKNYGESGIIFDPGQTIEEWKSLGSTAPQAAFRTDESFLVTVNLADLTAEHLGKVWDDASVTDTAQGSGTAGVRDFDLLRGLVVTEFGLLVRSDLSPYIASAKMQFWIPRCYVQSMGPLAAVKGEPMMTEVVFSALEHSSNGFGKYEVQDAAAT